MKIGTLDIRKAYKGSLELTSSNAKIGTVPIVPEPQPTLNYFYLENASVDPTSTLVMTPSDCFAYTGTGSTAANFDYSTNGTTWNNFSTLAHYGSNTYNFNNTPLPVFSQSAKMVYVLGITVANYQTLQDAGYKVYLTKIGTDTTVRELQLLSSNATYYFLACNVDEEIWTETRKTTQIAIGTSAESIVATSGTSYVYIQNMGSIRYYYNKVSSLAVGDTPSVAINSMSITSTSTAANYLLNSGSWTYYGWGYDNITSNKIYLRGKNSAIDRTGKSSSPFNITGIFNVGGDIQSLVDYEDIEATSTTLNLRYLFAKLTNIINANELEFNYASLQQGCSQNAAFGYNMFNSCSNLTTAPELPATTLSGYCYQYMFEGCTSLTTAPELPATTLGSSCYNSMFRRCSSLTTAPELPATTLANSCYYGMFSSCTGITTAPELPSTILTIDCYREMFFGCTGLTTAPELPATTLVQGCYYYMFYGCTGLTTAPELPATTLVQGCYYYMFYGCTNLNSITCLATDISASNCVGYWVDGVAATGTFIKSHSMSNWSIGVGGIPTNWTVMDDEATISYSTDHGTVPASKTVIPPYTLTSEDLPTLTETGWIFNGWNKSVGDTILVGTTITASWTQEVQPNYLTFTSTGNSGISMGNYGGNTPYIEYSINNGEWTNWDYSNITLSDGDVLKMKGLNTSGFNFGDTIYSQFVMTGSISASGTIMSLIDGEGETLTIPTERCFQCLFKECASLTQAPELTATNITVMCYQKLFHSCTGLTEAPSLPATTVGARSYADMFMYCTNMTSVPMIAAQTLVCPQEWYGTCTNMFYGCTNLSSITCLATSIATNSCRDWLTNASASGTFYKSPSMSSWPRGTSGIPSGWTVQDYDQNNYLTFTSTGNSGISMSNFGGNTPNIEYKLNDGSWTTWNYSNISLADGDVIKMRGVNNGGFNFGDTIYSQFVMTGSISASGTIMSLIDGTGETLTIPNYGCFNRLFNNCTSLTTSPMLPATTLHGDCYYYMFSGCSNLSTVPELPALHAVYRCYAYMFHNCTTLTYGPSELPATTTDDNCYADMFSGCSSLIESPIIKSQTLTVWCQASMFNGCSSLNKITCLATNISASYCLRYWTSGVAASGTFIKSPSMSSWPTGTSGIPSGWTVQDYTE